MLVILFIYCIIFARIQIPLSVNLIFTQVSLWNVNKWNLFGCIHMADVDHKHVYWVLIKIYNVRVNLFSVW